MVSHYDRPVADMVEVLARELHIHRGGEQHVPQYIGDWSAHAASWTGPEAPFPVHIVRYEDMIADPEAAFGAVVNFLGLPLSPEVLTKAIRFSRFDELRKQEQESGFIEKPDNSRSFFRKGKAGGWRDALAPELAERIIADHGEVMDRFGYLDDLPGD